ncbi:MAG TPA: ABC transporter permease [Nitrospiria bacterium]|jgi:peptide/nickel transport system permease protein|nr:ABC transporter permease [Nitrospiria bacterium]
MQQRSTLEQFWRRFRKNRSGLAGGLIVLSVFLVAVLAPVLSPYDPAHIDVDRILVGPTQAHPLGTDDLGRDVLSRMIWGSRISLMVGFVAVGILIGIGTVIGAVSGYYGGWPDDILMQFVDIMLSVPTFFLILAVIAFVGPNIWNVMIIIGATSWMGVARFVRGQFLALKEADYVTAARALGAKDRRIIFLHILPNAMSPVYVSAVLGVAGAILVESSLSFLGLGVQPPMPSWGNIITSGKDMIDIAWWLTLFPGLAILITVLGYNLLGEGLQDALNPRLKE